MPERLYPAPLTAFDAQSDGAELSVAAGGITVNAVNKIEYMGKYGSEKVYGGLHIYNGDIWSAHQYMAKVLKYRTSDLSANGVIDLIYGGVNANAGSNLVYLYVDGTNIYGLLRSTAGKPHVIVWNMDGTFVREQIADGVTPGVQNPWAMVSDGTYLYITDWNDRSVKKYLLDGTYVDKSAQNSLPAFPGSMCIGMVSGNLYVTSRVGTNPAELDPATLAVVRSELSGETPATQQPGQLGGEGPDRLFISSQNYGVMVMGVMTTNDRRGGFCRFYGRSDTLGIRGCGDLELTHGCFIGFDGNYLYIWDGGGQYDPLYPGIIPYFFHKIYVKENRTVHTAAPVITGEADLKEKTGLVGPSYLRLAVQEDADGGEITYYRSPDGVAWTEVTRASGFDLSGHSASDPLYLKVYLDNLRAKVGSPKIYGIDIIAEGDYIPTLVNDVITVDVKDDLITADIKEDSITIDVED